MDGDMFTTTLADLLAVQPARLANLKGQPAVALLSVRFEPSHSWTVSNFSLTQEQCLRLRNDLNTLLTDPESWLFTEDALDRNESSPFDLEDGE